MRLKWTDTHAIAIALEDHYPDVDVLKIRFTDLWQSVQRLPTFDDDPKRCNEKILEAIQKAWLDEKS